MESTGCYLVSWDFTNGKDKSVVLVGVQKDNKEDVINGFTGPEAEEIINRLKTPSKDWEEISNG